jgi:UDP-2,4-diacetamido-2,4,6-trideoxy-beta-L-altropyranose hydrolase
MTGDDAGVAGRLLILRADASAQIGTGHFMRLLALGQAWHDRGGQVEAVIAAAPDDLVARYESEGIGVSRLRHAHPDRGDAQFVRERLLADPTGWLAIDGPAFDPTYLDTLSSVARRILLIDDVAALARYPVGLVLNQNAHADRSRYPLGRGPEFLLGLRYVLLRREFRAEPERRLIPAVARRLLVTFGGADPAGLSLRTIRALGRLPSAIAGDIEVRMLLGAANPAIDQIQAEAARSPVSVTLEASVSDMREPIAWADLAIVSGGTTVWELARLGCPAIVVETSPSEPYLVAGLAKVGLFDRAGAADQLDDADLAARIERRSRDRPWRDEMAALGPRLVDGQGALRVVEAVVGATRPMQGANT